MDNDNEKIYKCKVNSSYEVGALQTIYVKAENDVWAKKIHLKLLMSEGYHCVFKDIETEEIVIHDIWELMPD